MQDNEKTLRSMELSDDELNTVSAGVRNDSKGNWTPSEIENYAIKCILAVINDPYVHYSNGTLWGSRLDGAAATYAGNDTNKEFNVTDSDKIKKSINRLATACHKLSNTEAISTHLTTTE